MMGRLFVLPALALLTACVGGQVDDSAAKRPLGLDFGNAIQHNEAAQVIDPRPVTADAPVPAFDGRRAAAAMARYQNGVVRELEIERTADSSGE